MGEKLKINLGSGQISSDNNSVFKLTSRGVLLRKPSGKGIEDCEILLCYNNKSECFVLPGGVIEHCDSARQTLVREMKEEFAVDLQAQKFLGVFEQVFHHNESIVHDYTFVFQLSEGPEELNFVQNEPHIKPVFVRLVELSCIDFRPQHLLPVVLQWWQAEESSDRFCSIIEDDAPHTGNK